MPVKLKYDECFSGTFIDIFVLNVQFKNWYFLLVGFVGLDVFRNDS